jgi:hypothetical protein
MDLTLIETMIKNVLNDVADELKADNFANAGALAELAEMLANARQGMK